MKNIILILPVLLLAAFSALGQTEQITAKHLRATQKFTLDTVTFTAILKVISGAATHNQGVTGKAVYDYVQSALATAGKHIIANQGTAVTTRDTLDFIDADDIDFTVISTSTKTTVQADIQDDAVGAAEIAANAVGYSELASNCVDSTVIINGGVSVLDINQNGATSGQVLKWNGTQWLPDDDDATPPIPSTEIVYGTGSGISSSPQLTWDTTTTGSRTALLEIKGNSTTLGGMYLDSLTNAGVSVQFTPDATVGPTMYAFSGGTSGSEAKDIESQIYTTSTNSGSDAIMRVFTAATSGDPVFRWGPLGSTWWYLGMDNDDSDITKLGYGSNAAVGGGTVAMQVATSGAVGINSAPVAGVELTVGGNIRITGTDGTPTKLLGADADGDVSKVTAGTGLAFSNDTLNVTISGGDDWGSQVVETDASLTGDGTSGDPLSWAGASVTGSLTGSGTSFVPLDVLDNGIGNAELRQSAGLSVIGRSANSTGNVADITAATDGHVLRLSGTTLGFGTVAADGIATGAITPGKTSGFTNNSITHANGSGVLTGDGTLTFETNTIRMYPTANDTLLAFYTPNNRMFGIRSFTDPYNGSADAIEIGGLSSNTRLFLKGYEIYPNANFRQYLTPGIGFLGSTGSLYLHTNGDYYNATLTGDNETTNRNTTYYFLSGGGANGKGNPVIFQHVFANNDTTCNSFEFLARNTASGGITHPDSTLFRISNWDRGIHFNLLQSGMLGLGTRHPLYSLDINKTDGIRLPIGTTAERPASTPAGVLRFNSDSTALEVGTGSGWTILGSGGGGAGVTDHGALTGLSDDDHTQYALLAGRSGGQVLTGGTGSGDDITLRSTSDGTKGDVFLNDQGGNVIIGGAENAGELRFLEPSASGSNYTGFIAGAMAGNQIYKLPTDAPSDGEVLTWNTGGDLSWEEKIKVSTSETLHSSDFTATAFLVNLVDCSGGTITVDPPSSPSVGDRFALSDATANAGTNNITVDFTTATQKIYGSVQDYILNVDGGYVEFMYVGTTTGWVATK